MRLGSLSYGVIAGELPNGLKSMNEENKNPARNAAFGTLCTPLSRFFLPFFEYTKWNYPAGIKADPFSYTLLTWIPSISAKKLV